MSIRRKYIVLAALTAAFGLSMASAARAGTYGSDPTTTTTAQQESQKESTASTQTTRSESQQTVAIISTRISSILTPSIRTAFSAPAPRPSTPGAAPSAPVPGPSAPGGSKQPVSGLTGGSGTVAQTTSGYSAGDAALTKSAWITYNHSWVGTEWDEIKSSSSIHTGVFGADMKVGDQLLFGVSGTYQSTSTVNSFSDGVSNGRGFSIVPYGAVSLFDGRLVFEALSGYGRGKDDAKRNISAKSISYNYDSDRWLASTAATYNYDLETLRLSARVGWMMSYDWSHKYTDSVGNDIDGQVTRLGEASIGGRAAYTLGSFEPYAGVTVAYDPILAPNTIGTSSQTLDQKEVTGTLGLNWNPNDQLTAGVEVANGFFRERQSNTSVSANLRYSF